MGAGQLGLLIPSILSEGERDMVLLDEAGVGPPVGAQFPNPFLVSIYNMACLLNCQSNDSGLMETESY